MHPTGQRLASLGLLVALALSAYWPAINTRPFEPDNVHILAWAEGAPPSTLIRGEAAFYPQWRPLALATVWLRYRLAGITRISSFFLFNLMLTTMCAWLIHLIVQRWTTSTVSGLLAAGIALTSPQFSSSVVNIIDRQSSIACLFGLVAWLIMSSAERRRLTMPAGLVLSLVLLASALGKEYGLAFGAAAVISGAMHRRRDLAFFGLLPILVYAILRLSIAGGATAPYCEDSGFFFETRRVCFDGWSLTTGAQAAYNIAATALNGLLPGVFAGFGEIGLQPRRLVVSVIFLAGASLGWRRGPGPVRLGLLLVGFNALLSLLLYRERNQVISACAIAVAFGAGLPALFELMRRLKAGTALRAVALTAVLVILVFRAGVVRHSMSENAREVERPRPTNCSNTRDTEFVGRLVDRYGLAWEGCR